MKKLTISIIITCILLTGCVESRNIEKLGIITAAGYDLLEDGWIEGTHVFFQFDPNATNISQILVSKAKTSKGVMDDASLKTSKILVSGHQRLSIFGTDLAKKGMMRMMDTMARDANAADMMYIALSATTAKDVLKASNFEDAPNIGAYLHKIIEKNVQEEKIPECTLHNYLHDFYDYGTDPILPLVKIEENKPTIRDLGVLQRDKLVGTITAKEGFFIKLIRDKFTTGSIELVVPMEPFKDSIQTDRDYEDLEGIYMNHDQIRSEAKIKLVDPKNLKFTVDIKLDTRLLEVSQDLAVSDRKVIKKLEKYVSKNIEQQLVDLLKKLQEMNSDPLGFGRIYESVMGPDAVKDEKWREMFPDIDVEFSVNTRIIRYGITN